MRILATIAIAAAATFGAAAPATAETPFPVCHPVPIGNGGICADPAHPRCVVYGGGTMWNACVINPLALVDEASDLIEPILPA